MRGSYITSVNFEKVKEMDEKISELIKNEGNYKKLTVPVCAFITFESDDAYTEAKTYSKRLFNFGKKGLDEDIERGNVFNKTPFFKGATEPTNIIWENRHIKGINYGARLFGASIISIIMLAGAFGAIFFIKKKSIVLD